MSETAGYDEELLPVLGYLAAGTTAMLEKLSGAALASLGVPPVQIAILMFCSRNHASTTEKLVEAIHLDPASISRHVVGLIDKGLIHRTRPFADRRIVRLELTQEGWAFMPRIVESSRDLNALVNVGIAADEKRVFLDVMGKIHRNLRTGLEELSESESDGDPGADD